MDNIILQLREKDTNTTNYTDGDFEVVLSEPIVLENNDTLRLSNAFIDTRDISTQYINIDEDTEINMTFYIYTTNHCGTYKIHGCDGFIFPNDYDNLVPASFLRQDGDPYFLSTVTSTSEYLSEITGVQFFPSVAGAGTWGDVTVVYKYPAANLIPAIPPATAPQPPLENPTAPIYPQHTISIYIPPQPATALDYIAPVNFSMIQYKRVDPSAVPVIWESLPLSDAFTFIDSSKPLTEAKVLPIKSRAQLQGFGTAHLPQPGFPAPPPGSPASEQIILNPVQNEISILIPKGKYIPEDLCSFINDSVVNFRAGEGVGIPQNPAQVGIPSAPRRQRLPFNPTPLDAAERVFGNLPGMPTFTQSNFIKEPTNVSYLRIEDDATWRIYPGELEIGDHLYTNYNPNARGDGFGGHIGNPNVFAMNQFYNGNEGQDITEHGVYIDWTNSGSFLGASQFSLEFDTNTNKFGFDYLHTPLYVGGGAGDAGAAIDPNAGDIANYFITANAGIVRKYEAGTTEDFGGIFPSIGMYDGALNSQAYLDQPHPLYKYCGNNGGICFTSLTPHSFWQDKLGFNLEPMEFDLAGNITKNGIISSHKFFDLGTGEASDGSQQRKGFNVNFTTLNTIGNGYSPQMPVIGFNIGANATSGAINLESAVKKSVLQNPSGAWFLVQEKLFGGPQIIGGAGEAIPNDSQNPDLDPDGAAWNVASVNVIGTATSKIVAQDPKLLNIVETGYYLVAIDTKIENKMINSNEAVGTIQGVVNRYYSVNSYTSSDGSNIVYTHRGEPAMITSLRVRILNPDLTAASVGEDNSVFISIEKNKNEAITSEIELKKLQENNK